MQIQVLHVLVRAPNVYKNESRRKNAAQNNLNTVVCGMMEDRNYERWMERSRELSEDVSSGTAVYMTTHTIRDA